jgi:hypothetical protein
VQLEPLIQLPNVWSGVASGFGVHLFEGKLHLGDMDRLEKAGMDYLTTKGGRVIELVVVFPSPSRMTGEERARMAKLMRRWEDRRAASATVILATGILGAVHRSVLTGLLTLAPPGHPARVFAEVEPALTWLRPYFNDVSGRPVPLGTLLSAVRAFSAAFRARPNAVAE